MCPGAPTYELLFGGVLGQEVANVTKEDDEATALIQVHVSLTMLIPVIESSLSVVWHNYQN